MGTNHQAERQLIELGLELPPAAKPLGVYRPVCVSGNLAFVSGHGPLQSDGRFTTGRLGQDVEIQAGYQAARQTGLAILSSLKANLGSLGRVVQLVKLMGLVNATADFHQHPQVINGASELFIEVFGPEAGVGARAAFGAVSLPGNWVCEIEAVFEIGS